LGYHGGTFNTVSRVLEVPEKNAHAWVEVYFPPSGWLTFEATPMAITDVTQGWRWFAEVYLNAARYWFNRYVINYNSETQHDLLRQVAGSAAKVKTSWNLPGTSQGLAWLSLLIVFLFGLRRGWLRLTGSSRATHRLPGYYLLFLKRVERVGYFRETGETFACFHRRLGKRGFDRFLIKILDEAIEQDLYSPRPHSSQERRTLRQQLQKLRLPEPVSRST